MRFISLLSLSLLLTTPPALAQTAPTQSITLDLEGFRRPVEIYSFSLGATGGSRATCDAISITKPVDLSSPVLTALVFTGGFAQTGIIRVKVNGVLTYELTIDDVRVSRISAGAPANSPNVGVTETVSLNAARFRFRFFRPLAEYGYDCVLQQPL